MSKYNLEMPLGLVDYKGPPPRKYRCTRCGVQNVKLWRDYNTFLNHQELYCLKCACKAQNKIRTPTEDGRSFYTGEVGYFFRTDPESKFWTGYDPTKDVLPPDAETWVRRDTCDQIGWLVPAVPTVEGDTFWGYTSVPQDGCEWWYALAAQPQHLTRLRKLGGLVSARRRGLLSRR